MGGGSSPPHPGQLWANPASNPMGEADRSVSSSADEVKNAWMFTSACPYVLWGGYV